MRELIVDSFAGGGGASTGIEMALGVSPDIAINHDAVALSMHAANHPNTKHLPHSIWKVDPLAVCEGRPVGLLWASPDCKHFSKAKGGKPVERSIRDLAWVVVRWARQVSPRVIMLENVEEFASWGPLGEDNKPCPLRKGSTFKRWTNELKRLGYKVEYRELRACDYGAPTIRKRLFLIARRDGAPIVWPQPTHGDPKSDAVKTGQLKPWRTAAEIVDWSLPCPSIFDTAEEIMKRYGLRAVRPLQPATMARNAKGVNRYVLKALRPFLVSLTHQGGERTESIDDPMMTVTGAHRGEKAVVAPFVAAAQHGGSIRDIGEPIHTITASAKDQNQIVAPFVAKFRSGNVGNSLEDPLATVTANSFIDRPGGAAPLGVVSPILASYYGTGEGGDVRAAPLTEPLRTQTTENRHAMIAPHVMTMRNAQKPHNGADEPTHTITSGGAHLHLVSAFMAQNNIDGRNGEGNPGRPIDAPVSTVLQSGSHQGLVAAHLQRQFGTAVGSALDDPARTVMTGGAGGKSGLSVAFLQKYYGSDQDPQLQEPLHTVTTKDRFGLSDALLAIPPFLPEQEERAREVAAFLRAHGFWDDREFVTIEVDGVTLVMTDIGMRMLVPRELFRAQGFADGYIIDRGADGAPITKTQQVSKCGNSVSPPMACALVSANFAPVDIDAPAGAEFYLEAAE